MVEHQGRLLSRSIAHRTEAARAAPGTTATGAGTDYSERVCHPDRSGPLARSVGIDRSARPGILARPRITEAHSRRGDVHRRRDVAAWKKPWPSCRKNGPSLGPPGLIHDGDAVLLDGGTTRWKWPGSGRSPVHVVTNSVPAQILSGSRRQLVMLGGYVYPDWRGIGRCDQDIAGIHVQCPDERSGSQRSVQPRALE